MDFEKKEQTMTVAEVKQAAIEVRTPVTRRLLGVDLTHVGYQAGATVLEAVVPPGATVPLHTHAPEESFYVMEGVVEFGSVGEAGAFVRRLGQGEMVRIPPGTPHSFRNVGPGVVRMMIVAEASIQAFFDEAGEVIEHGAALQERAPAREEIERVLGVMARHGQVILGPHPVG